VIDHLGLGRMAVLLVVALLVFGPDRLPEIAAQLGRALRQVRTSLNGMQSEIRSSVGPEFADLDLASLNPRAYVASLLADDEPAAEVLAAPAPVFEVPTGSAAEDLLAEEVDLSTVDAELAELMAAFPAPTPVQLEKPSPV
jgi:sec-independent protein translocase protein TatB